MRRLFWLAMGITLGVLVVRRLSRAAEKMTPQGIAGSLGAGLSDLADSIRDFAGDVREADDEREDELPPAPAWTGTLPDRSQVELPRRGAHAADS